MANEEPSKFSSQNLKVPPLKIVLSSHQQINSAIVNICTSSDNAQDHDETKLKSTTDNSNHDSGVETKDGSQVAGSKLDHDIGPEIDKKLTTGSNQSESDLQSTNPLTASSSSLSSVSSNSSSSSSSSTTTSSSSSLSSSTSGDGSSSSSERSNSATPSSESESVASNSTIISDPTQHAQIISKTKEDTHSLTASANNESKHDRSLRFKVIRHMSDKPVVGNSVKRSPDNNVEHSSEFSNNTNNGSKEQQTLNANQRITRSSQRAAQQNKSTDNQTEPYDDSTSADTQYKSVNTNSILNATSTATTASANGNALQETGRKVKRRKGDNQEIVNNELDNVIANEHLPIVMAEIYPSDYLVPSENSFKLYRDISQRPHEKLMKLNSIQPKTPQGFKDFLLSSGPYLLEGNKLGSGLCGARLDCNKNSPAENGFSHFPPSTMSSPNTTTTNIPLRKKLTNFHQHQQHKKMSLYSASQQKHSAYEIPKITEPPKSLLINSPLYDLFVQQEKARHQMRMQHLKERERSILTAEQEILRAYSNVAIANVQQQFPLSACMYFYYQERYHYKNLEEKHERNSTTANLAEDSSAKDSDSNKESKKEESKSLPSHSENDIFLCEEKGNTYDDVAQPKIVTDIDSDERIKKRIKLESDPNNDVKGDTNTVDRKGDSNSAVDFKEPVSELSVYEAAQKTFLHQLQEIDDKWEKIKLEMFIRHKNEADSLYAVQTLEWEWKAKEIGSCDVRFPLKIGPDLVPRVDILSSDY